MEYGSSSESSVYDNMTGSQNMESSGSSGGGDGAYNNRSAACQLMIDVDVLYWF
jgi:hypothetical protein